MGSRYKNNEKIDSASPRAIHSEPEVSFSFNTLEIEATLASQPCGQAESKVSECSQSQAVIAQEVSDQSLSDCHESHSVESYRVPPSSLKMCCFQ